VISIALWRRYEEEGFVIVISMILGEDGEICLLNVFERKLALPAASYEVPMTALSPVTQGGRKGK
jgi:hypothetical protein